MPTKNVVRLADFILEQMEPILQAWEDFAKTIEPPALTMDRKALRDHASHMLKAIAIDIGTPQTAFEQAEKSKARGPQESEDTAAETHAEARVLSGYTIEQLVSEYRALRASVLRLWAEKTKAGLATDPEDITRFNEGIDQALAESVARYSKMVKQSQNLFLAILGHDLRNPLGTTVMAASFIMGANDIDSKYTLAATRIFNSGQRMSKLVNDLIDFTRTHLGSGIPISPKQANIASICQATVDEMRTFHPDRMIEFHKSGEMAGVWDEGRIAQVFSNLIGNALQHGIRTEPVVVNIQSAAAEVVATIHNKGAPIALEKMQSIFEPMVRFDDRDHSSDLRQTSLGIGLYIAKEIVRAHGGTIKVDSSSTQGTTFTVRLPGITDSKVALSQK
jgi:signal transduction histidine kinase